MIQSGIRHGRTRPGGRRSSAGEACPTRASHPGGRWYGPAPESTGRYLAARAQPASWCGARVNDGRTRSGRAMAVRDPHTPSRPRARREAGRRLGAPSWKPQITDRQAARALMGRSLRGRAERRVVAARRQPRGGRPWHAARGSALHRVVPASDPSVKRAATRRSGGAHRRRPTTTGDADRPRAGGRRGARSCRRSTTTRHRRNGGTMASELRAQVPDPASCGRASGGGGRPPRWPPRSPRSGRVVGVQPETNCAMPVREHRARVVAYGAGPRSPTRGRPVCGALRDLRRHSTDRAGLRGDSDARSLPLPRGGTVAEPSGSRRRVGFLLRVPGQDRHHGRGDIGRQHRHGVARIILPLAL